MQCVPFLFFRIRSFTCLYLSKPRKPPLNPKPIQLKLYIVWCLSEILKNTAHANCFHETESGSIESIDGQTLRHEWSPCFWISSTLSISTRLSIAFKYRILPTTTWGQQPGESPCYFMVLHDQQIMNHSRKTKCLFFAAKVLYSHTTPLLNSMPAIGTSKDTQVFGCCSNLRHNRLEIFLQHLNQMARNPWRFRSRF